MQNGENKMKQILLLAILFFFVPNIFGQYAPKVGEAGSTAISKDSSIFLNWANQCKIVRGLQNITDTTLGYASVGDSLSAIGKAGENGVVSLGDGGFAICTFPQPITNGSGYDFAVFENSFDDSFLELAFVEVSSDGINFFRFPAHSLIDTLIQTASFGLTDATKINNLAGKYRGGYGTPFDLEELAGTPDLDIQNITHVKVIDVVGSIENKFATRDAFGNKVNDPFPTPFPSGGFDLDAIGVINQLSTTSILEIADFSLVFPNPVMKGKQVFVNKTDSEKLNLYNLQGKEISNSTTSAIEIPESLNSGIYVLFIQTKEHSSTYKIVVE
ncbi:MAG: T9SS type A sorting domain-containing protein [Chitinophagales bacterium]|nr:T9SS type A sorting domain-containing protein [Chitinophagales bacterium]